ncbi:MAG: hypothetical protein WDZ77_01320 [Candidatus Pacearchaeota archaeon]
MVKEKEENLIHLKFAYTEALNSKKDLLYSQKNLMEIDFAIKKLISLKEVKEELGDKLHKKMSEFVTSMRLLKKSLPELKVPKIIREENVEGDKERPRKSLEIEETDFGNDLEAQIKDIQEKLKRIHK